MNRRRRILLLGLFFFLAPAISFASPPADNPAAQDTTKTAHITYISGTTVYVDAGRSQGIAIGQELQVVRDDQTIASLKVMNLATQRASCTTPETDHLQIGDVVRYTSMSVIPPTPQPKVTPSKVSRSRSGHWLRSNGLRGRLGLQYLTVRDMNEDGQGFSQPILGLRLDGNDIGGSPLDASVDVRARRTYRTSAAGNESEGRTRVYRLNLSGGFVDDRLRLSLGRQISPNLSSVNIFDGLLVELFRKQFTLGMFSGTQPDPVGFSYSTGVFEYGAFGLLKNSPGSASRWAMTGGFVTSTVHGVPNRSYLFLRARLNNRRFNGYVSQEVDLNSGWKQEVGEDAIAPTSTVVNLRHRLSDQLSIHAGFDNRRRIRLYRDRTTPETEFNDSYRTGWNAGSDWKFLDRFKLGLGFRASDGASAGSSDSYTATLRARVGRILQTIGSRHTRYTTPISDGWLHSFSVGGGAGQRYHLDLHAGIRDEERPAAESPRNVSRWFGFDADLGLARGLYVLLSAEFTRSDVENNNQTFSGFSYRF